ncbi:helix-turn-helix domain-containing protein [Limibacter armeniacum]|uniref:helix-turn-helix domain-containing protein n=1 Tax=Limibacter armeniacum TaxID=466084 RepID=UPI002FE5838D
MSKSNIESTTSEVPFKSIEISAITHKIGSPSKVSGLALYDSLQNPTEFIFEKPFRSNHFSILIVTKGTLKLKVNLLEYTLQESEIIIIPPSAIREFTFQQNIHFKSILFTQEFLKQSALMGKYLSIANFLKEGISTCQKLKPADYNIILQLIKTLTDLLNNEAFHSNDTEVVNSIFKATLLKIRQYYDEMHIDNAVTSTVIYRFLKLLSEHYLEHREVTFYAEKLHMNEKYLTQLLKKKTGKTTREFITEMVNIEAKVLLNNKQLTIKEIAHHLNFMDQFHFSRFFKKYVGISPSQYRKSS